MTIYCWLNWSLWCNYPRKLCWMVRVVSVHLPSIKMKTWSDQPWYSEMASVPLSSSLSVSHQNSTPKFLWCSLEFARRIHFSMAEIKIWHRKYGVFSTVEPSAHFQMCPKFPCLWSWILYFKVIFLLFYLKHPFLLENSYPSIVWSIIVKWLLTAMLQKKWHY